MANEKDSDKDRAYCWDNPSIPCRSNSFCREDGCPVLAHWRDFNAPDRVPVEDY